MKFTVECKEKEKNYEEREKKKEIYVIIKVRKR